MKYTVYGYGAVQIDITVEAETEEEAQALAQKAPIENWKETNYGSKSAHLVEIIDVEQTA